MCYLLHTTQNQKGTVLIPTIFLLSALALLALPVWNRSLLQQHASRTLGAAQQQFYAAESGLRTAENQLIQNKSPPCEVPAAAPNTYVTSAQEKGIGCMVRVGEQTAYYVIEKLLQNPCGLDANSGRLGVSYFRVTAWAKGRDIKVPTVLQSTVARLSDELEICSSMPQTIHLGRRSWRWIFY